MTRDVESSWLTWSELPWLSSSDPRATSLQVCDRLLSFAAEFDNVSRFLHEQLPEIATEFSAQWVCVIERTPQWQTVAEFGRQVLPQLPFHILEESLDRSAAGWHRLDEPSGCSLLTVPLAGNEESGRLLLLVGRMLSDELLAPTLAIGRVLANCLHVVSRCEHDALRIDRLKSTLEITSSFARARKSGRLMEVIAIEATRLLDCDRSSIFIWDEEENELVACPALGLEELRIPDNAGIVGEVIQTGAILRVDDAYSDSRFNPAVDKDSGYRTRNLICVPMRDTEGQMIGAFEAINKNEGAFNTDDEESLTQLGVHAATAMQNTREWEELIRSRQQLTDQIAQGVRIIGESAAIVALRETIKRLAATDLPVLVLGESGTGKEVVAQALHFQGPRAQHPFVAVNCAAIAETLLESELFGPEKGAFTDAHELRQGKFELADGGTLFLDEIGDMSPGGQAKLLRVLEQKVVTRVGGSKPISLNVRVIAATNSNLIEAVREKRFREDLYYRLSVVTQLLPPLRDRPEDILQLAEYFLKKFSIDANRPGLQLSDDARRRLQCHSWPGNVRELKNLMERVAFLSPTDCVEADEIAFILSPEEKSSLEPSQDVGLTEATQQFQQDFIQRAIKRVGGNMSEAARLLGLHRSNLYRKMRQLAMGDDVPDDE